MRVYKDEHFTHLAAITGNIFFVLFIFLSACTPKTSEALLPITPADSFSLSGTQEIALQWWTAFGDENLNAFIDTALSSNFNIKSAWQRMRAARAVLDRESASLLPFVEASASGGISKAQLEFQESQRFQVGIISEYEVDLWGRIRAVVDAEKYRAAASHTEYQRAIITLSAEITRTWFQLTEASNQLDLIHAQIATNEQILRLITNRFGTGDVRSVDILRQRQLLEATREQKTYIEADIAVLEYHLAVLSGRIPQDGIVYVDPILPFLPPLPDAGIPIDLLQRRPDVQTAWYLVQAADRDLAAAISHQYPRLSLSASVSSVAENVGSLFKDWTLSIAGNLLAPIFYGGQLRAEVERSEAVKEELLNIYGQTALVAFQEVESALIREQKQLQSIQSLEAQLELATQSYEQLRIEYLNGLSDYLDVLTALDQEQQIRRDLLTARRLLLEYRVDLYEALAGGVDVEG